MWGWTKKALLKKKINNLKVQSTKWETVSAVPMMQNPNKHSYDVVYGDFRQTITLFYIDWPTMEHNRRLMQLKLMQREQVEKTKSIMKSKESGGQLKPEMKENPEVKSELKIIV